MILLCGYRVPVGNLIPPSAAFWPCQHLRDDFVIAHTRVPARAHTRSHTHVPGHTRTHRHAHPDSYTRAYTGAHAHSYMKAFSPSHSELLPYSTSSSSPAVPVTLAPTTLHTRPSAWDLLSSTCHLARSPASFLFWFQGHFPSSCTHSIFFGDTQCFITVIPREQGFTSALLSAVSAEPGRVSGRCAKCSCSMTSLGKLRLLLTKDVWLMGPHNLNAPSPAPELSLFIFLPWTLPITDY